MTDDCYQLALGALRHHLDEAGAAYQLDDGEVVVGGHRLGLAVTFEEFVRQGDRWIAPLDIQIHLDGDTGDRFRMGTLGVGETEPEALRSAVAEWHLLAAAPVLAALGAAVELRKARLPQKLADWNCYPGRVGIRGRMPAELEPSGAFYRTLLAALRTTIGDWEQPARWTLRSICLLTSVTAEGQELQAAIDGMLDTGLTDRLAELQWPKGSEPYLFKQLLVLQGGPGD